MENYSIGEIYSHLNYNVMWGKQNHLWRKTRHYSSTCFCSFWTESAHNMLSQHCIETELLRISFQFIFTTKCYENKPSKVHMTTWLSISLQLSFIWYWRFILLTWPIRWRNHYRILQIGLQLSRVHTSYFLVVMYSLISCRNMWPIKWSCRK